MVVDWSDLFCMTTPSTIWSAGGYFGVESLNLEEKDVDRVL